MTAARAVHVSNLTPGSECAPTGGPLSTAAAVQYYAASMALALEHLHMCGVVYR
jgi:hypothetical protein